MMSSFATLMMDTEYTENLKKLDAAHNRSLDWADIVIIVLKFLILGSIILTALLGNLLVIISVVRHRRLRTTKNYFIISLAMADILVALFAMTFSASVVITNKWLFSMWLCDFWNSCDVLFSTASIMHLSCISYDRYYAIMNPLSYPIKVTTKRVYIMLACVWLCSALISYIPIFTGIYTTEEGLIKRHNSPHTCEWVVNMPYAIISSTVSFWLPCAIMLTAYYRIYSEAIKQEKYFFKGKQMGANKSAKHQMFNNRQSLNRPKGLSKILKNNAIQISQLLIPTSVHGNLHGNSHENGLSTPIRRTISKLKNEHRAAKTLGIILGSFIVCWAPFFVWYLISSTICGTVCSPKLLVDILFWVGYLNSAMNPAIYAYFNRQFRAAFKETLQNIFGNCLRLQRHEQKNDSDSSNISSTYHSTKDVDHQKLGSLLMPKIVSITVTT